MIRGDKNLRKVIRAARHQGWVVEPTRNGHLKFVPPNPEQRILFTGSTPSDHRGRTNFRKDLERSGLSLQGVA